MKFYRDVLRKKRYTNLELVEHYQESNDGSFLAELFQRHSKYVFCFCLDYLKNKEESKDAVMDIFLKLAEDLKNRKVTNFKALLRAFCKNYCLMKMRRMDFYKNQVSLDEFTDLNNLNQLILEPVQDETEVKDDEVEIALVQLNENQKACVRLFYLEEKSYREIASETGFELNQVRSNIQNGKRNLKKFLLQKETVKNAK